MEIEDLRSFFEDYLTKVGTDKLLKQKASIEKKMTSANVWNSEEGTLLTKELSNLNTQLYQAQKITNLLNDVQAAKDLNDTFELEKISGELSDIYSELQNKILFDGQFDNGGALIAIHAGAGGVDAQDFAAMLMNMYQAFFRQMGWGSSMLSLSSGEEGGLKSVVLEVTGDNVYGYMQEEAGVHRLVRLSPFNAAHTRETSFASVEVLPIDLDKSEDIKLEDKNLRFDYFMSSGKGGQSVNTTYSAVRVMHIPTGLSVACQKERSQIQNKETALKLLKIKLIELEVTNNQVKIDGLKNIKGGATFGSQIRSYVMHPYKLVKDHRSKHEVVDIDNVLNGNLVKDFIIAQKKFNAQSTI